MPTVNILDAFGYKWGQTGTAEPITDDQWKLGWSFIGATPPSVEQFNKWGQVFDEKSNYLYSQLKTVYDLAGIVPASADMNSLRDALRGTGLFTTAAVGTNTTAAATTEFVQTAASARAGGSRVKGLAGATVTPGNTTILFTANEVVFRNAATGGTTVALNVAPPACNVAAAGPIINGRDQAGAFANSSWVHFYFITNGVTTATIASAAAPTAGGPTLPAGYTASAYIGCVRFLVGVLANVRLSGAWTMYEDFQPSLVSGTASVMTAVNCATLVPPNALKFQVNITDLAITSNGSGAYSCSEILSTLATAAGFQCGIGGITTAGANTSAAGWVATLANIGQQYFYRLQLTSGTGISSNHAIVAYQDPNGGE